MMSKFKLKFQESLIKSITYSPLALAISLALAAAYRPLSLNKDILEDYSLITQDGFQWILQGRALANFIFGEPWPQLRNPGYVLITALDSFLGSQGIAIAISVFLALLIQILVIYKISFVLNNSIFFAGALVLAYILNPIQFIALHVLSDALSIAWMFIVIYGAFLIFFLEKHIKFLYLASFGLVASQFQLYTLFPILFIIIFLIIKIKIAQKNNNYYKKALFYVTIGLIAGILLRQLWYKFIDHASTPNQLSLIDFNLANFNFYVNTWGWLIAPLLFLYLIFYLFLKKIKIRKNLFSNFIISLTLVYSAAIFFYDWQESRFSYFLVGILFICFSIIVSGENRKPMLNTLGVASISIALIFGSVYTPENKWAPKIGESVLWRPWILHGFWGSPPYAEYVVARNKYCVENKFVSSSAEDVVKNEMPLITNSDPDIGIFAIKNCL